MRTTIAGLALFLVIAGGCAETRAPSGASAVPPAQALQQTSVEAIETPELCRLLAAGQERLATIEASQRAALMDFYAAQQCEPLWIDDDGLNSDGRLLLARLTRVSEVGQSGVAPLVKEAAARSATRSPQARAELELLLSAAFAATAIDPQTPEASLAPSRALQIAGQARNRASAISVALPTDPAFWRLRSAIGAYRQIETSGGWPAVPGGEKLELGSTGPRIAALQQRLLATGDLSGVGLSGDVFDAVMAQAVRGFQARHGLEVDGVVGDQTLTALNTPVRARLSAMISNLQRLLHPERDWGPRYISVNIAAGLYKLVEDGITVFERRAILGRPSWPTPRLNGVIDRLEFHPYWVVPANIARLEVMPKVRKDPGYLARHNMRITNGQIRQAPGPSNPLGRVKFIFFNPYSVYLHDTSAPILFDEAERFFSHGCIRIERALDLAARLLQADPAWSPDRIAAVLAAGQNYRVDLPRPIPLHLVYDTVWVDDSGVVQFRKDAYGLDRIATASFAGKSDDEANCR